MSYERVNTANGVTVMNKELYDNLQDGIDESKSSIEKLDTNKANAKDVYTKTEVDEKVSTTNTNVTNLTKTLDNHTSNESNPHSVTASQIGLGNVNNTSDLDKPISSAQQTAINNAITTSKEYTDTKVANLVGSAPETLDTLEEVAKAINDNEDVVSALNSAIGTKANNSDLTSHTSNTSNPHKVTASQVGLGNVPNLATNDQTPTYTVASSNTALSSGEKLSVAFGKIAKAISSLISHLANKSNPHSVTKLQVGLGNVDNTSDLDKPISTATQGALDELSTKVDNSVDNLNNTKADKTSVYTKTEIDGKVTEINQSISGVSTSLSQTNQNVTSISQSITNITGELSEVSKNVNSSGAGNINKTTVFNEDGSITETTELYECVTVFNEDGSITETKTFSDSSTITKTTTFNDDGSITEVFE